MIDGSVSHRFAPTLCPATLVLGMALGLLVAPALAAEPDPLDQWPSWRGPLGQGVAPNATPPVRWSETENVKWKVRLPGSGTSTPVIWKDTVYLLTAVPAGSAEPAGTVASPAPERNSQPPPPQADAPQDRPRRPGPGGPPPGAPGGGRGGFGGRGQGPTEKHQFVLLALDRATGATRWQQVVREEVPHEGHHRDHGYASMSPVTDGEHLIVYFGSRGLHGFDMDGKRLWQRDLGQMRTRNGFGEGNSPILHGNTVVVVWDHEGEDFIAAFDKRDGRELWRTERDEPTNWTTPLVVAHDGRVEVVVNGTRRVRSYDIETGKLLWETAGQTANAIPSPVQGHGHVFVTSGFQGSALQAIKLGGSGELSEGKGITWTLSRSTPYVPSPLLYDDLLYYLAGNNATLSITDAKTGRVHVNAERLEGLNGVYATPLGAAGRVYILGRDGGAVVLKKGPALDILATNRLDDGFDASPVAVGLELFLRGRENLYCIAE